MAPARPPPSSVLFQSDDEATVLLDIPRTLEEAQVLPGERPPRRICSAVPPLEPFPTPEPQATTATKTRRFQRHASSDARSQEPAARPPSPAQQITDLMTAASVEAALRLLASTYTGPFHLPRPSPPPRPQPHTQPDTRDNHPSSSPPPPQTLPVGDATPLHGSIQALRSTFLATAPLFDLIVLDPPWPNRSARRRRRKADSYHTAGHLAEMRALLTSIPVAEHLSPNGLVAIWITNKAAIRSLLTSSSSAVFPAWGVELATEWTWLKITARGEPLCHPASVWRKPWERLLVAKRIGVPTPAGLGPKVIVAAPDVHSRKPNLRGLFGRVFGQKPYPGLEVFARNLTAGWWSWGDQVLLFQEGRYWRHE